ncbi:MAG: iron-containing alcohol dehydrogenase [Bacteroidales bacterium]
MVTAFQFSRLPQIYFGSGRVRLLPGHVKWYGSEIILITGRSSFINSPNAAPVLDSLRLQGVKYHHVIVPDEPSPETVDNITDAFRQEKIDAVVAIGGGSVIDAGKAVSAMMYKDGTVMDYLEVVGTKEHPGTKLPFIAVPATSGTGSEATKNAVISRTGKNGFKRSLRHENFVPDIAIVDPVLTLSCPEDITAASGMDCFTQLTESYLSERSTEYTDALALEGIKAVRASLLKCFRQGKDIDARAGMSFAALTSGICLANAGLGAVHGFASAIGGIFRIPHGVVCGTLMASANSVTVRELRKQKTNPAALAKYAELGRLFAEKPGRSANFYIDSFIEYLYRLTYELRLPRLGDYDLTEVDLVLISKSTDVKNNPVKLGQEELFAILKERL